MAKKIVFTILCTFLFFAINAQTAFAANNVSDINVEVALKEDGSAYITQT